MKYFTRDWCSGKYSDDKNRKISPTYDEYIESNYRLLPFSLKLLSRELSLHDGLITSVEVNKVYNNIALKSICGDLSSGYFLLNIGYLKVEQLKVVYLEELFNGKKVEILYDELEILGDDKYSHKLIFNKKGDLDITFRDLEIQISNVLPSRYMPMDCTFLVIEED